MFKFLDLYLPKMFYSFAESGSLINLDEELEAEVTPEEEESPESTEEPKGNDRVANLEKRLKDSQEFIRQQSEDLKELKDFKKRLTGADDSEAEALKLEEQELREKYDIDPINTIDELINKKVEERTAALSEKANATAQNYKLDKVLASVKEEYDVNFSKKNSAEIVAQLKNFSPEAKKKNPKGCLIKAMKLAGIELVKREAPFIQGASSGVSAVAKQKEADAISNRLFGKKAKAKTIFE